MAAAQAAKNHEDERGLTYILFIYYIIIHIYHNFSLIHETFWSQEIKRLIQIDQYW